MGRAHEVRAASMAKTAAIKSKQNAKYSTAIYVAAKSGVPDPDVNQALKKEIEKAKREHIPADVIKRAIEKAKGGQGEAYNFVRYEGFGPGNCAVIVDCLTDNVNRTYTSVKVVFSRCGFRIGEKVAYMFDNVSLFTFKGHTDEEVLDALVMADCDVTDVEQDEEYVTVYAPQSEYAKIKNALIEAFGEIEFDEDETTWLARDQVELSDPEDIRKFRKFEEALDDIEDVQELYHNAKIVE